MRTSHFWTIGAFLLAASNAALAQVQLVYKVGGQAHVISGTEQGRLIYREDGKMMPVTGKGEWEIRPTESFAASLGSVDVSYYFQPWLRQPALKRDGKIELCFRLEFHPEESTRHLYYVCAWEVDGQLVAVTAREFFDAVAKKSPWIFGQMPINAADRRGRLRAYLFNGDKSLRGVDRNDLELTEFRSELDRGDTVAMAAWLRGAGQGRTLPQPLVEQIARSGDAALLELALTGSGAKHAKGRDGDNLLLAAAETGRESCVDLLLQHKIDSNAVGDEGSALYRAAAAQSAGSVAKLLAAGARPERDWEQLSSLNKAVRAGDAEICRLLLDHGAKIPENWKKEVFARAAGEDHADLVSLLLEREAKSGSLVDVIQFDGTTPLMQAANTGAQESMRVLEKAGASLIAHDSANRTAAAWALKGGQAELAVKLFKQAPLTGPTASRLLHDALLANNDELVGLLLAADATLDFGAADFDTVVELVVRTGNLPVLTRALSRGLDVNRKFNRDWNLAGMAERYHRPEVTAVLEKQAGHKLERNMPKPEKLEVSVSKSGPLLGERDLGKEFHGGEARVDIYIDAEGMPHLPMLRSATDDRLGRAVLANVLTWRFDRLAGNPNVWRRIIFPYDLPPPDPAERIAQSLYFDGEVPWINPDSLPSPAAVGEAGIKQAAWVRFVVSATGEILAPRVLAVTTPGIEDQVLAVVKSRRYYPARQGQEDIACPLECVVILPGKFSIAPNYCVFLGEKAPDDFYTAVQVGRDMRTARQRESGLASKNAVVLAVFTIDRTGFPGKFTILGSPGPTHAALAEAAYNTMNFQPLVVDHKEMEYRMAMTLVFRDENDR